MKHSILKDVFRKKLGILGRYGIHTDTATMLREIFGPNRDIGDTCEKCGRYHLGMDSYSCDDVPAVGNEECFRPIGIVWVGSEIKKVETCKSGWFDSVKKMIGLK